MLQQVVKMVMRPDKDGFGSVLVPVVAVDIGHVIA